SRTNDRAQMPGSVRRNGPSVSSKTLCASSSRPALTIGMHLVGFGKYPYIGPFQREDCTMRARARSIATGSIICKPLLVVGLRLNFLDEGDHRHRVHCHGKGVPLCGTLLGCNFEKLGTATDEDATWGAIGVDEDEFQGWADELDV